MDYKYLYMYSIKSLITEEIIEQKAYKIVSETTFNNYREITMVVNRHKLINIKRVPMDNFTPVD